MGTASPTSSSDWTGPLFPCAGNGGRALVFAAFLILAVAWLAAGSPKLAAETGAPAAPLIVVAGPESGPNAVITREVRAGVDEEIALCRATQPLCPRVAFTAHACSSAPEDLESVDRAVADILTRNPFLVIGHPCERAARTAAEAYAEAGIPFVAVGVRDPGFLDGFENAPIGRIGANRADEARALISTVEPPVAIVHDRTLRNSTRARLVTDALERGGIPVREPSRPAATLAIVASNVSYDDVVAQVVVSKARSVVLLTHATEAAVIIRQLRAAGFEGVISGPGEWVSDGLTLALASDHVDGAMFGMVRAVVPLFTPYAISALDSRYGSDRTRSEVARLVSLLRPASGREGTGFITRSELGMRVRDFSLRKCSYAVIRFEPRETAEFCDPSWGGRF